MKSPKTTAFLRVLTLVSNEKRERILSKVIDRVERGEKTFVVTLNTVMLMQAIEDDEFREHIEKADIILPDGEGVCLAKRLLRKEKVEKIAGIDFAMELIEESEKRHWQIFLLGGEKGVAEKAAEELKKRFLKLNVTGIRDGYFSECKEQEVIKDINKSEATLLFVGMGTPKQEKWISRNINKMNCKVFIGIGGALDVWSKRVKRAPKIMITMRMEWLYRISRGPIRRLKYTKMLIKFLLYLIHSSTPDRI
ncbi:MAG: WecB/TagA/CpsF family glycosyltransferase [Thermotogae bacterium]|nr:WecB/TagA/CpsF family glycosyltransferase [Thermotogota bacterium]